MSGLGERKYGLEGEVLIVGEGGGLDRGVGELVMSGLTGVGVCRAGWEAARRVVRGELCGHSLLWPMVTRDWAT